MSERTGNRLRAVGLGLVVLLGNSACGSATPATVTAETTVEQPGDSGTESKITYQYIDGMRITKYPVLKGVNGTLFSSLTVLSYCDGPDLVDKEQIYDDAGGGISRTPNAPQCADGKLTPEDFALPPR